MEPGRDRAAPIEMAAEDFRALGHALVDQIADFLASVPSRPVTPGESVADVQAALGGGGLPERGEPTEQLLREACELLFEHSLLTGHPRFLGYVIGAPAPVGALADFLAAAVNPNLGGWPLSPVATEIERQTVRWIAELIGYPRDCGGLLVSGGSMANFIGFLAARRAKAPWDVRTAGADARLRAYCSAETHTWIQKAADMFGIGTDAVRWVPTDDGLRMDVAALRAAVTENRSAGLHPFLVIGTGGSVSTGAVDPLPELARLCRDEGLWFHVDGAYGAFAVTATSAPDDLHALAEADSVALDPHKWLYSAAEVGCALVRDPAELRATFDYTPRYYHLDEEELHYYQFGPQNTRGFRALKVWLALRQIGREGYAKLIEEDMALARYLGELVDAHLELEPGPRGLSITTFRYVPADAPDAEYVDRLNEELLGRLQAGGELFVSNAVIAGRFYLRSCIVNFRTTRADIEAIPEIVTRVGTEAHTAMRETTTARA